MSVSEFQIPREDKVRHDSRRETASDDKCSARFTLLIVVLSSLILWSGIFLTISWIF